MSSITQVRIENFKSIIDTGWVDIHPQATVLVGANEAGKSNFLEALNRFTLGEQIGDGDLSEYLLQRDSDEQIPDGRISIRFENAQIRVQTNIDHRFSGNVASEVSGTIYKLKDGRYEFQPENNTTPLSEYQSNRRKIVDRMAAKWGREKGEQWRAHTHHHPMEFREAVENEKIETARAVLISGLEDARESIRESEEVKEGDEEQLYQEINNDLRRLQRAKPIGELIADEVFNPVFYKDFEDIPDRVPYEQLEEPDDDGKYEKLMKNIGLTLNELRDRPSPKRRETINSGTESFAEKFNRFWPGEDVSFDLDLVGDDIELLVSGSNGREQFVSQRSEGFQHFLSFMIEYVQNRGGSGNIILIDDPDLHLHPKAQKKFRKALFNMANGRNIIYSTHSPYMIEKTNLNSVRVVENKRGDEEGEEVEGTTITKIGGADSPADDSLSSVRTALGARFSDSLFVGKKTILVEGYDDRLYLRGMSDLLGQHDRVTIDGEATIVDCGGASKVDYLSRIVDSEEYNYSVILDGDDAGQDAADDLTDSEVSDDHIHLVSDVMDDTEGSSVTIEDLLSVELFCEIAAEIHDDDGITTEEFEDAYEPPNDGIVKELDNRIKKARGWTRESADSDDDNEKGTPDLLRKTEIASNIQQLATSEEGKEKFDEETLNRFESLIEAINTSLESSDDSEETSDSEEEAEAVAADD
ncbi:AAA family ATPase [Halorussus salinisoli]|uniref:AAA family ATPase n=1 Tax=Halorussus salinisoli TaxID=2558242 RepID=UPI0010C1D48D|nr:ATP-binding protein [Halorussus salinisoli]